MVPEVEVKIAESSKKLAKSAAKAMVRLIQNAGTHRFDVALSGGSTPSSLFSRLARKHKESIDWQRVHFWWGDERCVSPESSESNYKMAFESFLSELEIPEEHIHRIKGEANPEEEAVRYGNEIREHLNSREEWPVFDLILLGLGEDGHTASIFPDRMDLLNSDQICAVAVHPQSGQKRITLTGKVINNANTIYFLVSGEGKAERISEIMNNDEKAFTLPAYHVLPVSGKLTWFLDEDASEMI